MNNSRFSVPSFAAVLLALVAFMGCGSPDPVMDSGGLTPDAATTDRNPSNDQGNPIITPDVGNDVSTTTDSGLVITDAGVNYCMAGVAPNPPGSCAFMCPPGVMIPSVTPLTYWPELCDNGSPTLVGSTGAVTVPPPCFYDAVSMIRYVSVGFAGEYNGAYACGQDECYLYRGPGQSTYSFRCSLDSLTCSIYTRPAGAPMTTVPQRVEGLPYLVIHTLRE